MSVDRTPAGSAVAHIPAAACGAPSASICNAQSHWRLERLAEARGVLADIGHHPDTLVLLACQVIYTHSPEYGERTDVLGVMRLLQPGPPETVSAAPKSGAA
jgi:hypothetical protein